MEQHRGRVDLIVTDPPYNTGRTFRYRDSWGGEWVSMMKPRLLRMQELLKPGGVLAICIDDNELFRLGLLLDEVFGEQNRIAIINWQKSYGPRNDNKHVSRDTEYVLVYAKNKEQASTNLLPRNDVMNAKYKNPDNDPAGPWKIGGDATVATPAERDRYAIQSPFTGALHYPGARAWSHPKKKMKEWLEQWGSHYEERELGDGRAKALVLKNAPTPTLADCKLDTCPVAYDDRVFEHPLLQSARQKAEELRDHGVWPMLYFTANGTGRPALKRYLQYVKQGKIPTTFWAEDDYDEPFVLGTESWSHKESGHTQAGISELNTIIGKGHNFQTVKPLQLIKKLIHIWCPPDGIVLDPFAGSGTTAHAVLDLNHESGADRQFILIEQGNSEAWDQFARTLTRERVRRVAEPLSGGFEFIAFV
ncbi:site-specific DNA-methyltransferase [Tumebacillus permanentifrigoris]|uniref:site-specific DNA-methyltransferase n=1 Tax=Tumebacillus permanentifrigoris TaxID=378543 RepID=UPI001FE9A589|nr:site-specific DNA-methyltransferase [Tumebacillus permanentifrigoris]